MTPVCPLSSSMTSNCANFVLHTIFSPSTKGLSVSRSLGYLSLTLYSSFSLLSPNLDSLTRTCSNSQTFDLINQSPPQESHHQHAAPPLSSYCPRPELLGIKPIWLSDVFAHCVGGSCEPFVRRIEMTAGNLLAPVAPPLKFPVAPLIRSCLFCRSYSGNRIRRAVGRHNPPSGREWRGALAPPYVIHTIKSYLSRSKWGRVKEML